VPQEKTIGDSPIDGGTPADELRKVYASYDSSPSVRNRWSAENPGNAAMLRERERVLGAMLLGRLGRPLAESRVLDAGCGWGHLMAWLAELGVPAGNLTGVDMIGNRLAAAREAYPGFRFLEADLSTLQEPVGSYDLIVCSTLFSSIKSESAAARVAANLRRLLRSDGAIVWYDIRYPNPWNPHVRPLRRADIATLFPDLRQRLESLTLVPQLARRLGPAVSAYPVLAALPPLRSHLGGLLEAGAA
jgi:2-polyprenyl-3-methyl-5-hydroxy-6-metoxy-1,4-benzoquinol methylase